jgi:CDP-glycerol glycerophosphotransferase (TagB/SpsB family)
LIKLHPSDKAEPVRELLGELDYDPKVLFEGQLIEALSGADIVISQRSTTIAEAALLDKTIVLADIYGLGHEYGDTGICLCADTPKELAAAIDKAITDPAIQEQLAKSRQTFKEQYFYKLDGQSASRVVNALESLCPSLQTKSTTEVSV